MNALSDFSRITEESKSKSSAAYSSFVEAMRGIAYGPEETLDAWIWFKEGWDRFATVEQGLRSTLKWALKNGATFTGENLRDSGCGCCDSTLEPPADLEPYIYQTIQQIRAERG